MIGQKRLERQARRAERRTTEGRGTRKERKKSKHELRRELKAMRRARWQAAAGSEANRKPKRSSCAAGAGGVSHPLGPCGNHGCLRCSPVALLAHTKQVFRVARRVRLPRTIDNHVLYPLAA